MKYRILPTIALAAIALIIVLTLAACGASPAAGLPTPEIVDATTATSVPTAETQPTETAQPTATALPSATPTETPKPTPQPVTLAVMAEFAEPLSAAPADSAAAYRWAVSVEEDPAAALADGRAQLAVVPGDAGTVVRQEPLAFAVPFTTNWELIGAADAAAILANGHSLVRVIPWSAMKPDIKALRVDGQHPTDPDYPYRQTWSLSAAPGYEDAAAELAPALTEALAPLPTIRLAAVGDINFDRSPAYIMQTTGDLSYPLSLVKPIFDQADYTIANLETALGDVGEPAAKRYPFRSPPESAEALALGSVDLVSLANNHAQDYGPEALLQGIDLLHAAGVATVGGGANESAAYAPHVADINGLRVAFLGYVHVPIEASTNFDTQSWTATADAPGLAWADPARVSADVAAIRSEVDLVVVILHSGYEYIEEPSEEQVAAAHAAIDAGADLVVGHHAHILQGIHRYNGGVIVYGLGNFLFNIDGPPETTIVNIWLDRDGVRQVELLPAIIQEHGQPRLAEFAEAGPILARVYYLTTILNAANP
ncbi:MAG: CapA family protein [Candidatus Promineofilum sp.]|nr:CapA family protein [Promineifilum sp.]